MAKDKDNTTKSNSIINKLANNIQSGMAGIYKNTFFSSKQNKNDLDTIKAGIDDALNQITDNNKNTTGLPNISRLYVRGLAKNGEAHKDEVIDTVEKMFNDPSVTDALLMNYGQNKYLRDLDDEIDLILRYMPQLEDALDAKKDNVLSADHYSKDFITVTKSSSKTDDKIFLQNIDVLKDKYNLIEQFETFYDNTAHYGEQFIYLLPYKKALKRLLACKNGVTPSNIVSNAEAASLIHEGKITATVDPHEGTIITEGSKLKDTFAPFTKLGTCQLKVELGVTGILESAVNEYETANKKLKRVKMDNTIDNELEFEGPETTDGFIDKSKINTNKGETIEVPGCIVKKLRRENVLPIYIDDLCLGYYYVEYEYGDIFDRSSVADPSTALKSGNLKVVQDQEKKDEMLKHISKKLSSFIDAKFINANQDLKEEIYMILKHNDMFNVDITNQMKITYIPPEDMVHMYFKKDEQTRRGISDLDRSLLPAKLYTSLYVTNTIGILTRGQDKRVYYVKQNVDTNISATLLNTINQIKKSNFGARELSSIKNVLNITGRYNDYVIPRGPSGESPVDFEVMQGQDIDPKVDFMNQLEQMAINGTDVPYEFIQARQTVDYAVRLTMSNGKFLRKVFKRQALVQKFFSRIITVLYNSEFDAAEELEVQLPPPAFLNIANTNQMIQNTNDYVTAIVNNQMTDDEADAKAILTMDLNKHYLSTYLDTKVIDDLTEKARMKAKQKLQLNNQ